ncbi:class I SAM-dependent methyltransferase [Rhizobium sp. RU36D]|uniref:class I SAM-dependent methyltransferase n=1 Tax=Rhizobium sp. RU36D TaxID=1907415 RepID=UPI0024534CCF|nr:class I SAM-dependent methyltransferase [Rhizobium sp. RU36D]
MFSISHLNTIRAAEIEVIAAQLQPAGARVLEIGAGTGQQAAALSARGYDMVAIEMPTSNYAADRVFPIVDFDGSHIPFPDHSFDIVFSSNVLEHVPNLVQMHSEIRRVLKPGGYALHVLPTHSWRFWTTLSAFPAGLQYAWTLEEQLFPRRPISLDDLKRAVVAWYNAGKHVLAPFKQTRHGERGNIFSETWLFRPGWWRKNFRDNRFDIVDEAPIGLFYTGNMVFNEKWSIERRRRVSHVLGSACHMFKLKPRVS